MKLLSLENNIESNVILLCYIVCIFLLDSLLRSDYYQKLHRDLNRLKIHRSTVLSDPSPELHVQTLKCFVFILDYFKLA